MGSGGLCRLLLLPSFIDGLLQLHGLRFDLAASFQKLVCECVGAGLFLLKGSPQFLHHDVRLAESRSFVVRLARQLHLAIEIGNVWQIKVSRRKSDQLRAEMHSEQRSHNQTCSDKGSDKPSAHTIVPKGAARLIVFLILRLGYWRPMCRRDPDWSAVLPDPFFCLR
ncbi:hypothetical protein [Bradyrhizobium sp. sGM-13]|uniref:hypothetical protein n=1 Tax=Bradyrhizobium sp. sGM-13 TaxID=2831781 RepID=UPI001BCCA778|nr:hypothetical protein [Bradyrhizobium sp. sGM-13]